MADLGKAYVQIVPSAKGISGSITKAINPESVSAGKKAGESIAKNIGKAIGKTGDIGKKMTKNITLPVAGAVTAVGGLVSALGWGRLTGLDSAKAQLKGLGYEIDAVERISSLVSDTIQGTTITMAEGVSIAAGALAAGVEEGADLERYIRLVGDAAVGAGRDTGEMAQIFNRVQGAGKLMTMELNMIEQGLPGFAQAMADSLGVPQDEFRKMVTEGKVSSEQFLDVMEGFAGSMSGAYAESWDGIVSRTKSNIGILGEIMLGGVFEQSKESLAQFLEYIRTDEVRGWFEDTGQAIGSAFNDAIESIKNAIDWWINLDDSTKQVFKTLGTIVVVIGPMLTVLSKVALVISKIIGVVTAVTSALSAGAGGFAALKAGALALMGPVGWITALLVGLVAGGIALYMNWDTVKEKAIQLGNKIKDVWNNIKEWTSDMVAGVVDWFKEIPNKAGQFLSDMDLKAAIAFSDMGRSISDSLTDSDSIVLQKVGSIVGTITDKFDHAYSETGNIFGAIKMVILNIWDDIKNYFIGLWNDIMSAFENAANSISNIWNGIASYFTNLWSDITNIFETAWETIKNVLTVSWLFIKEMFSLLHDIILIPWNFIWENFSEPLIEVWESIKTFISETLEGIASWITEKWNAIKTKTEEVWLSIKESIILPIQEMWEELKVKIDEMKTGIFTKWNEIKTNISNKLNEIKIFILDKWNEIKSDALAKWLEIKIAISSKIQEIKTAILDKWNEIKADALAKWSEIKTAISNKVQEIKTSILNKWNEIKSDALAKWNEIKSSITSKVNEIKSSVTSKFNEVKTSVSNTWNSIKNAITTPITQAWNKVKEMVANIKNAMNFSWSLPKLKMPHFSISGKFSLNPPSVPKMGIEWYKHGGIMKRAMAFGMNGNNVMVGGEAGAEAILPLNSKTLGGIGRGIVDATPNSNNMDDSKLDTIIDLLSNTNQVIVLDSGELVGGTYTKYSEHGGNETRLDERWGRY